MGDDKTVTEVMKPVTVNIVGAGDGGITRSTTATTPADQPDLHIRAIPQVEALASRFAHAYFTMLSSLVLAGMTTNVIPASDFLHLVYKCAGLSLAAAGIDLLKGFATITSQWAKEHPLLSGEV